MADTHQEQLLSDLLRDVARDDERLEAPHLEARILASASLPERARSARSRAWVMWPVAAAAVFAVAVTFRPKPDTTNRAVQDSTEVAVAESSPAPVRKQLEAARKQPVRSVRLQPDRSVRGVRLQPERSRQSDPDLRAQAPERATVESPVAHSQIEFVPLLPMTEQELAGPFQIVRVQMPGASLGSLRSPLVLPNEMIEADVLLGEDGRARAIRVNTSGSIYPWRPR